MTFYDYDHAILKERNLVFAQKFRIQFHLLIGFVIHERVTVAIGK